jgi:lambda family phage portal protein
VADLIGRVLATVAPERALKRAQAQFRLKVVNQALARRGYDAAKPTSRWAGWFGSRSGPNAEIAVAHAAVKDRARDLVRNDPHASRAPDVVVALLLGSGIVARSNTGVDSIDSKVDALFKRFASVADADGDLNLDGLIALALTSMVESGDSLIRRRRRRAVDGLPVPLQIQVVEGDLLDASYNGPGGDGLLYKHGIGFDGIDRRRSYMLYRSHPGENFSWSQAGGTQSVKVDAADIIHVFRKRRPGQLRGVSWFAPVIALLRDKGDYHEAALVKKRTESLFGVAVTSAESGDGVPALSGQTNAATKQADEALVEELNPGMLLRLKPGEDVKAFAPSSVASDLDSFMLHTLMAIATGLGLTYDQLTGDMRQANFSSLKAADRVQRRFVEQLQWLLIIPKICDGIWNWFIEAALQSGALPPREGGYPAEWTPPGHESIDPKGDLEADLLAVFAHRMTWKQFIERNGYSFLGQLKEQKAALAAIEAAGLKLPVMQGAAAPAAPDAAQKT